MFKQITVILLISAFATQTFNNGFVMLNYYTNTAAFAKNCVNKAQPKMHCNGKCQMVKKLKAEESKDQQMPERKLEKKIEITSNNTPTYNIHFTIGIVSNVTVFDKNYLLANIAYPFFRPPKI